MFIQHLTYDLCIKKKQLMQQAGDVVKVTLQHIGKHYCQVPIPDNIVFFFEFSHRGWSYRYYMSMLYSEMHVINLSMNTVNMHVIKAYGGVEIHILSTHS